jgi:hypothetical protein
MGSTSYTWSNGLGYFLVHLLFCKFQIFLFCIFSFSHFLKFTLQEKGCIVRNNSTPESHSSTWNYYMQYQNEGTDNLNAATKDFYWDVVAFPDKEYAITVSSLMQGDFGIVRWDFEDKSEARRKCWVQMSPPSGLVSTAEGHTIIHGYDMAVIHYHTLIAVSVYKLASARVYIIDATDMKSKFTPVFLSLVGKGTGRVDSFSDNFSVARLLTCIIDVTS